MTDPGYNGTFSRMFNIDQVKMVPFDSITQAEGEAINVPGIATEIEIKFIRHKNYLLLPQGPQAWSPHCPLRDNISKTTTQVLIAMGRSYL